VELSSLPPLPRSSIAAVLLHREELALRDDQVKELQEIDEKLAARNDAIRDHKSGDQPESMGTGTGTGAGSASGSGSGSQPQSSSNPQGTMGGGGGGRVHMTGAGAGSGSGAGFGRHGQHGQHPGGGSGGSSKKGHSAQEQMDDNDTRAYLQAEGYLDEDQRVRARDIAEKYREDLYDRRAQESER